MLYNKNKATNLLASPFTVTNVNIGQSIFRVFFSDLPGFETKKYIFKQSNKSSINSATVTCLAAMCVKHYYSKHVVFTCVSQRPQVDLPISIYLQSNTPAQLRTKSPNFTLFASIHLEPKRGILFFFIGTVSRDICAFVLKRSHMFLSTCCWTFIVRYVLKLWTNIDFVLLVAVHSFNKLDIVPKSEG